MNILIIEDDIFLLHSIRNTFLSYKFYNRIDILSSYEDFLNHTSAIGSYDIVLLDINLGVSSTNNWLDILKYIRKNNTAIPIIMMSSNSEYCYIETAFSLWAHDYITKPFRNRELQIRIERWFRNYVLTEYFSISNELVYAWIIYDLRKYEFFIKKKKIILTKGEKYLLSLFFIHKESLLTQDFLIEKIWWYSEWEHEKNLRIKIMRLKNKLKPFGVSKFISTVRWEWYIFSYTEY
jgi:DNA-binding response OmpR family regulator